MKFKWYLMVWCWVIGAIYSTMYSLHIHQLVEAYFKLREAQALHSNEETFNALVLIFRRMLMTLKITSYTSILDGSKNQWNTLKSHFHCQQDAGSRRYRSGWTFFTVGTESVLIISKNFFYSTKQPTTRLQDNTEDSRSTFISAYS